MCRCLGLVDVYAQVSTHVHAQSFKLSEQGKWECGPNQISVTELDLSFLITGLIQSAFKPHTWKSFPNDTLISDFSLTLAGHED